MTENEKTSISKYMSLILRHEPGRIGLTLDMNGWANTDELIEGMNRDGCCVTMEKLKEVVETNDKQRFKFNDGYDKIRANQGHSVFVDLELAETSPPAVLYHGTASRFVQSIQKEGLTAKSRMYVHLSGDPETAAKVGKRHGEPVVLKVGSGRMHADGHKFYLSENNVWLTASVPVEYIEQ